jgi:hypothetical protein
LITEEQQLQEQLTRLRTGAINTLVQDEKEAEKSIDFLEKELKAFEDELTKDALDLEKSVEKVVEKVEKLVVQ